MDKVPFLLGEADKDKAIKDECTKMRKEVAHFGSSFQHLSEQSLASTEPVRVMARTIPARLALLLIS